jgi:hypothetical protein
MKKIDLLNKISKGIKSNILLSPDSLIPFSCHKEEGDRYMAMCIFIEKAKDMHIEEYEINNYLKIDSDLYFNIKSKTEAISKTKKYQVKYNLITNYLKHNG